MTYKLLASISVVTLGMLPASAQTTRAVAKPAAPAKVSPYTPPKTPDGQPDLQGIWNIGTVTPMERPADLAGKEFFTEQEARAFEKQRVEGVNRDKRDPGSVADVSRAYNDAWWDSGTKVVRTRRTSMVTDPPDGKIPALTPEAQKKQEERRAIGQRIPGSAADRPLAERCLMFPTDAPPMTPYVYNNNFQIVQSKDSVAIYVEMVHDIRVIPLDGRPHLPSNIRRWLGDSRGRWEGNTLVVDTTNYTDKTNFRGSDQNLHVIERFTRTDAETILYQWTVDDPTAFTKPWKGELTMAASTGPIYEYACHEGNYGMMGVLSGARVQEKEEAAKK